MTRVPEAAAEHRLAHTDLLLRWFDEVSLSITPAQAVAELDNFRLADTVFNLRGMGYEIETEMVERVRFDGRTVRHARYHFRAAPPPVRQRSRHGDELLTEETNDG